MNRNNNLLAAAGTLIVMACIVPPRAEAQNLARRLAGVKTGTVRMSFASRDDICGYNDGISTNAKEDSHSRSMWNSSKRSDDVVYDSECNEGPARVVARFENGQLTRIRTYVGGRWRPAGAAALNKLMDIAKNDKDREARKKAMFWLGQSRDPRVASFLADMINR